MKIFGQNPKGDRLERIKKSLNYSNEFNNLEYTPMMSGEVGFFKTFKDFINKPKTTNPSKKLPFIKQDLKNFAELKNAVVWFGHSSYLVAIDGITILVDPVFCGYASPFSFFIKAFDGANEYDVEDLPEIDFLLLTHDHYDHLDYKTIKKIHAKIPKIICSLGVGSHLEYWGVESEKINELDWNEDYNLTEKIKITATAARHFSGRGIKRAQTFWSSFVLKSNEYSVFLGGDSGYGNHFKTIGEKYGPFDLALLECGQYNLAWHHIHVMPEELVIAAKELKAKMVMPVHWAKFALALHPWTDPIERLIKAAQENNVELTTPKIGEFVIMDKIYPKEIWWRID